MHLSTTARNASANALADLIDLGSGVAQGYVEITDLGASTVLATIPLNNPAFFDADSGVITLDVDPDVEDTAADNTGTASEFYMYDRDANSILDGSVGTSGADLNLNSVSIVQNVPVRITSCVITVPSGNYA